MKLSEFEQQSLSGLKEAVKQVYKKASSNNQKLVIGDYKGNPRLINASDFFTKPFARRRSRIRMRHILRKKKRFADIDLCKSFLSRTISMRHLNAYEDRNQGFADVQAGRVKSAEKVFEELRKDYQK